MSVEEEIQKLQPGSVIELFELDCTVLGGEVLRFHAGTNGLRQNVIWQGEEYTRYPVEATGFDYNGDGSIPRPKLRVSNALSGITALLLAYQDLQGATLTRKRTLAKFLDAENTKRDQKIIAAAPLVAGSFRLNFNGGGPTNPIFPSDSNASILIKLGFFYATAITGDLADPDQGIIVTMDQLDSFYPSGFPLFEVESNTTGEDISVSYYSDTADPTAEFADDVFVVDRKVSENREAVEFELTTSFDLGGIQLPRRQVIQNVCPWRYRGGECGYAGTNYFTSSDVATAYVGQDVCGKRLSSCKLRFGAKSPLPFGGFPGADLISR